MIKWMACFSLAVALLTPLAAEAQCPTGPVERGTAVGRLKFLGGCAGFGDETPEARIVAAKIINGAFGLLGIIVVGFYIYGGFLWMTAAGESEKVETAQKILKETTIGLAILIFSYAIALFVLNVLLTGAAGGTAPPPGGR